MMKLIIETARNEPVRGAETGFLEKLPLHWNLFTIFFSAQNIPFLDICQGFLCGKNYKTPKQNLFIYLLAPCRIFLVSRKKSRSCTKPYGR